jgi:hypothetical protein
MSLFRSILQSRPLQPDYDLPLYRIYQEPEVFPPAPIGNSDYMPQSSARRQDSPASGNPRSYDLVTLQRRERYYQQKLQDLLDAQSDGLIAGLEVAFPDDEESIDTPTQTTYSLRSNSLSPAPQARKKKRSLGSARRAIWKTVLDCADVKKEEDALLKQELRDDQAVLHQLESWFSKRHGLREKIAAIENEDTNARSASLKEEATRLESEIQDMEVRLAQMKTRHRQLVNEIADVGNSVQSKLSSFKTSLLILEQDVQSFLKSPPAKDDRSNTDSAFLALPPKRRTLDMAREHWQSDIDELKKQRRAVRRDRAALEDGAAVWKDVVGEITDFEHYLRRQTAELARQDPTLSKSKTSPVSVSPAELLEKMELVSCSIEEKLSLAHKKQWRLLEICIEAELQALQQGKEMLEKTFELAKRQTESAIEDREEEPESEQPSTQSSSTKDLFSSATEGYTKSHATMSHSAALRKSMYENDEPDPELLFTRTSDDTE